MADFLTELDTAESRIALYLNKHKQNRTLNRLEKLLHAPIKYPYHLAYKAGLIRKSDVRARTFFGREITVPLWDDNIVVLYYCGSLGSAECRLTRFFLKHMTPQDVFYDIGSNFGFYTYLAEAIGCREVHTFEPNETTMRYIKMNARPQTMLNACALSDTIGTATFNDIAASHKSGMSTLMGDVIAAEARKGVRVVTVPTTTLDEYVKTHTPPTVIKLDVESSEALVLTGGREFLRTHAPIITMETWDAPVALAHTKEALAVMQDLGYSSYEILPDGEIVAKEVVLGNLRELNTFVFKKD